MPIRGITRDFKQLPLSIRNCIWICAFAEHIIVLFSLSYILLYYDHVTCRGVGNKEVLLNSFLFCIIFLSLSVSNTQFCPLLMLQACSCITSTLVLIFLVLLPFKNNAFSISLLQSPVSPLFCVSTEDWELVYPSRIHPGPDCAINGTTEMQFTTCDNIASSQHLGIHSWGTRETWELVLYTPHSLRILSSQR